MLTLQVQIRHLFGHDVIYPMNAQAKALAEIAGAETLTPRALRIAEQSLNARVITVARNDADTIRSMVAGDDAADSIDGNRTP